MSDAARAALTLVVPLYDVEPYLPELLTSLSAQEPGDYDVEVIFIDDGSPDASAALADAWAHALPVDAPISARLIRQPNAGVSAARNRGLDAATGEWISFPDSDDVLEAGYLRAVASFLASHPNVDAAACAIQRIDERKGGALVDSHALRGRFAAGSRVVELDTDPDVFQLNVATAFFPVADVRGSGVRFVEGLHASEDALFVAEYLLGRPRPRLGLIADAHYRYRKRARADSAVDRYVADADSYLTRFAEGYLPLLERAARVGAVPGWLQSMLLYEYRWLFAPQLTRQGYAAVLTDPHRADVLRITRKVMTHIDAERVLEFAATALPIEVRFTLLALKGAALPAWQPLLADKVDADAGLTRVRWYEGGDIPAIPAEAVHAKWRDPDYFGQRTLHELIAWVPTGTRTVTVGDEPRAVARLEPGMSIERRRDLERIRAVGGADHGAPPRPRGRWARLRAETLSNVALVTSAARTPLVRRRFAEAWIVDATGDDQRMRAIARAAVTAGRRVFIVTRGVAEPGARTIRPGSPAHHLALLAGREHLSSRVEAGSAIRPAYFGDGRTIRLSLVCGEVLQGADAVVADASDFDLLLLGDRAEADAVTAPGTPTRYTDHEAIVVGHAGDSGPAAPGAIVEALTRRPRR